MLAEQASVGNEGRGPEEGTLSGPRAEIDPDAATRTAVLPPLEGEGLGPQSRVYLVVRQGEGDTRLVELAEGGSVRIGRGREMDLSVDDGSVSRQHAVLRREQGALWVEDLGSHNGTIVARDVVKGDARRLEGGELVRIGPLELVVAVAHAGEPADTVAPGSGSRLERELARAAGECGGHATLVRIAVDPARGADALAGTEALLGAMAIVEARAAGEYAALLVESDAQIAERLVARLQRILPQARVTAARYPENGDSAAALLEHARSLAGDAGDELPDDVICADEAMRKVLTLARRLARANTTVLVTGETGVGKEVVAELLHRWSARSAGPLVRLNCAALPETLLESELFGHERGAFTGAERRKIGHVEAAHGGTLFLDEVGEMPASTQVKLLRVLESRRIARLGATEEVEVDVRVVCATHRDLEADVTAGRFREDLYYRISAFALRVPPLRERPTEIMLLAEVFARRFAQICGSPPPRISSEAARVLMGHRWPGNVRQLRNAIEHAVVMADAGVVLPEHLPESLKGRAGRPGSAGGALQAQIEDLERERLRQALESENWNQTRAAARLGISRRALIYKMGKYALKK
jgi:DNA-binding NtrC family response regulator